MPTARTAAECARAKTPVAATACADLTSSKSLAPCHQSIRHLHMMPLSESIRGFREVSENLVRSLKPMTPHCLRAMARTILVEQLNRLTEVPVVVRDALADAYGLAAQEPPARPASVGARRVASRVRWRRAALRPPLTRCPGRKAGLVVNDGPRGALRSRQPRADQDQHRRPGSGQASSTHRSTVSAPSSQCTTSAAIAWSVAA